MTEQMQQTGVTPERIAIELGRATSSITPEQDAQWTSWIAATYDAIYRRATNRGVEVAALDSEHVGYVVTQVVARRAERPSDGADSVSEQVNVDDGGATETRRWSSWRRSTVESLLDDWWGDLGLGGRNVGSTRLVAYGRPSTPVLPLP